MREGGYDTCTNLAPKLSPCALTSIEWRVHVHRRGPVLNKRRFLFERQVNNLSGLQKRKKKSGIYLRLHPFSSFISIFFYVYREFCGWGLAFSPVAPPPSTAIRPNSSTCVSFPRTCGPLFISHALLLLRFCFPPSSGHLLGSGLVLDASSSQ